MKKSKTRLFIRESISSNIVLYVKGKQYHLLKNVLRVVIGDEIRLFDGITGEWQSTVLSINRNNITLRVDKNILKIKKNNDLWLIFAPLRQSKTSLAVQKATELGISIIIPCITEYTNSRNVNIKNLYGNIIEASEQSERLDIPKIEKPVKLKDLLNKWPKDRYLVFCDEKNNNKSDNIINKISSYKNRKKSWAVLIGPEGGFSDSEKEMIINNNFVISVSLGNRVLRSDTAITASIYCINELIEE